MYLSCTNLPIWKRLIWMLSMIPKDGHHGQCLFSDPLMGNNGSGWTRSFIPSNFLFGSQSARRVDVCSLKKSDTSRRSVFPKEKAGRTCSLS